MNEHDAGDTAAIAAPLPAAERQGGALAAELGRLGDELQGHSQRVRELSAALDGLLAEIGTAPEAAEAPAAVRRPLAPSVSINWEIGPASNVEWAYGNNARRLAAALPHHRHAVSGAAAADIVVYFDALVAQLHPRRGRKTVLRLGGPRPLQRRFGDSEDALRAGLAPFDAVVALNAALYFRALKVHPNVHLVPNALNLDAWGPVRRARNRPFRVGFAGNASNREEAAVKGLAVAEAAAVAAGVPLLRASRRDGQIRHARMREDFFAQIDVLLHPVGPGREGTSNVVMEALASGVPVVTTTDCGFHAEFLTDGRNVLIRPRTVEAFAAAITTLQHDRHLRQRLQLEGRRFARRHHDVARAAAAYDGIIAGLLARPAATVVRDTRVCVVPAPDEALPAAEFGAAPRAGYDPGADVVIVRETCSDADMAQLAARRGQFVVYAAGERYDAWPRRFAAFDPPVAAGRRFRELLARADLVVAPTAALKGELSALVPGRPVAHVPSCAAAQLASRAARPAEPRRVLALGGSDGGAGWIVAALAQEGHEPVLVAPPAGAGAPGQPFGPDGEAALAAASLCVLAHDPADRMGTAERFFTAVMHGVPVLTTDSPGLVRDALEATGNEFAMVADAAGVAAALRRLGTEAARADYVATLQAFVREQFGGPATQAARTQLLAAKGYRRSVFAGRKPRVAFVTHNLTLGEGAPRSLLELAAGLARADVLPFVYAPGEGTMQTQYREAGLPVTMFAPVPDHVTKLLSRQYVALREHFAAFMRQREIEAVVCNTVRAAPFAAFARAAGVPAAIILRESFGAAERFTGLADEPKLAAVLGLANADDVIFVSAASRAAWADQAFAGRISIIPNGIDTGRFRQTRLLTREAARAELQLPESDIVGLCVGTINVRKGQQQLLEAFAGLPEAVTARARLVFLGAVENAAMAEFREAFAQLPEALRARVTVVDATETVGPYYAAADVLLVNSTFEAYPRNVVEALHFGLPVLSTPVFGLREQVRHGRDGFLYDFDDMTAWRGYFTALVTSAALRAKLSKSASEAFHRLTSYEEMLLAYKAVLARLLATRRGHDGPLEEPEQS